MMGIIIVVLSIEAAAYLIYKNTMHPVHCFLSASLRSRSSLVFRPIL